ncbi:MAG TPA: hypothetical protein VFE53_05745, partial [Mucilaginibacter sp.]|nr:hypothetical protein [Mucilaginibacter sp.]
VKLSPFDAFAIVKYKNGKITKLEFYNGTSFLSQSSRFINIDATMQSVRITDTFGHVRDIALN